MSDASSAVVGVPPVEARRYHAFDSLRATMMLLGIYLHAVVAYSPSGGWPYKQPELTGSLDHTLALIHVFRMPVFYVMAGFFAVLLYERRGFRLTLQNRVQRILVPFVVGWLIIFPVVVLLASSARIGLPATLERFASGAILERLHPLHLWFLEYLLVLYGLAIVTGAVIRAAIPAAALDAANRTFRAVVGSHWAPLVLAVPSFFALLPMRFAGFEDPPGFIPVLRIVIAYAIPFAFGWLLYLNVDLVDTLRRRAWLYAGLALIPIVLYLRLVPIEPLPHLPFAVRCAIHSLALWLLILSIIGLFDRFLSRPNARMRYICDSSYFLYLAHMPVLLVFQLLLLPLTISPLLKIAIALAATVAVLFAMYRYGVRPTFVGVALNGRRYPTGAAPAPAASGAVA
jgi:glucan biosynthesis protein C